MCSVSFRIFLAIVACFVSVGCASSDPVNEVRYGTLKSWGPIAIQDQLTYWDCFDIAWSIGERYESFSTVNAVCRSASRTAFNSKVRSTVCLNSIEFKHHCLDLFDTTETIQLQFAIYSTGKRIELLNGSEVRLKSERIVRENKIPMSYLANIRDHGHYKPEVSYATLEFIERNPRVIDKIWNELILGTTPASNKPDDSKHLEIAQLIIDRLKEAYTPDELAYLSNDLSRASFPTNSIVQD